MANPNLKRYEGAFYAASRVRDGYGSMQFAARLLEDNIQDTELDFRPVARALGETALEAYRATGSWKNTELSAHMNTYAKRFRKAVEDSTCKDIVEWAGIDIPQEGQDKIRGFAGHTLKEARLKLARHQNRNAFDESHRKDYTLGHEDLKTFSTLDTLARIAQRKRFRGSDGIHSQVVRLYTEDAIEELYRAPDATTA